LTLTPEETRRIYGISQLEGGIEPSLVINRLLDLDTELRRKYRLSLPKTKRVSEFLDFATERGWKVGEVTDFLTGVWNSGLLKLDQVTIRNLISLAQGIDLRFWGSTENFIKYAAKHYGRIGNFRSYYAGSISLEQFLRAEGLQ